MQNPRLICKITRQKERPEENKRFWILPVVVLRGRTPAGSINRRFVRTNDNIQLTVLQSLIKWLPSVYPHQPARLPCTGKLRDMWKRVTLEQSLTCVCDVEMCSQSPPSVAAGEFGGSACILRLRDLTTECMPPLRLFIMAHPFPPGSTPLVLSPLPSPPAPLVYHHPHHHRRRRAGKRVDSPILLRTNSWADTHNRGPRWRRRHCLRHRFCPHWAN